MFILRVSLLLYEERKFGADVLFDYANNIFINISAGNSVKNEQCNCLF